MRASTPEVRLESSAECIEQHELEERIAALPSAAELDATVRIVVRLRPLSPRGVHADVEISTAYSALGVRSVETTNSDCRDIDDALLVVIDALLSTADLPPVERGLERPEAPPPVETRVEKATPPTHSARAPVRTKPREPVLITGGLAYALGVVPGSVALLREAPPDPTGENGDIVYLPERVAAVKDVRVLGMAAHFTCAAEGSGDIWCWGWPNGYRPYRMKL